MTVEPNLQQRLERLLASAVEPGAVRARIGIDAQRLCQRIDHLLGMSLIPPDADREALHLACWALQLPQRSARTLPGGRPGGPTLRERAEQAAELLLGSASEDGDAMAERAAAILRDLPARQPDSHEARLLADAVNLDDFGITGLFLQAMNQARQNAPVVAVVDGFDKRLQYGYWDARLKDGFHFEPIRQLARRRLDHARQVADLLAAELREDQAL